MNGAGWPCRSEASDRTQGAFWARRVLIFVLASGCGRETHVDPETAAQAKKDAGPTPVLDRQTLELSPLIPSSTRFFVVVRGHEPLADAIAALTVGGAAAAVVRRFAHHVCL